MWIPESLLTLFNISKEVLDDYRVEATNLRTKNEILERELASSRIMSDWLRREVNQLNAERVVLLARAYPGLILPTPEIARAPRRPAEPFDLRAIFEHQEPDVEPTSTN